MTNYILADLESDWGNLLPLTYTRPISKLRCGILTLDEKWMEYLASESISYLTKDYLQAKYRLKEEAQNIYINASLLATAELAATFKNLNPGDLLLKGDTFIAANCSPDEFKSIAGSDVSSFHVKSYPAEIRKINYNWDLFTFNGDEIRSDFELLTKNRQSTELSKSNTVIGPNPVFLAEGATAEAAIFNTVDGPVYLGKEAEVMEGAMVRGPFALGDHSTVKMGAKIYANTTIGPNCKVGGEINNSVFLGFANKAHDGFLGQAVIGEWCNIGADSNNSNLKNNYETVKAWNYPGQSFMNTGLQFCGLIMGDHSKCGINTMFNTGTTIGVSCNIFGGGFPRTFIPSFSWGGPSGMTTYRFDKAMATAALVMARRQVELDEKELAILNKVFEESLAYRK